MNKEIFLKDYTAPLFGIPEVSLDFDLQFEATIVRSKFTVIPLSTESTLVLNGEKLELLEIKVNGATPKYDQGDSSLSIYDITKKSELEIKVRINPAKNTELEGLYKSREFLITQCEPEGFRKITYFLDRPDVLSKYTVTLTGDKTMFPKLLSNGNLIVSQDLGNNLHMAKWRDPFPKPCYLFALVAGNFEMILDTFKTMSGSEVALEIYCEQGKSSRCEYAMDALKKAMTWDEERFGREYDLDRYMIVATDDFNAGAMENKGLNIFNSRLVLADTKTATDYDFSAIESVIGHEYFHNWTGNRVTLRDWFHLSLKEGLTVFRDQEFSMDLVSRGLIRIESVEDLRSKQFPEDASPNAHPIRPESCYAVDNFFTSTIYEKGSEVIRMMQTMVGKPGFRKGMDLYFENNDGKAVIIEDFANCISTTNNQDWKQFERWYHQAGTPTVQTKESWDESTKTFTLKLDQSCELTSKEKIAGAQKLPFHIPLEIAFFNRKGNKIEISHPELQVNTDGNKLIHLKEATTTLTFAGLNEKPIVSLNRNFSAPIYLKTQQSIDEMIFLIENDDDAFQKWELAQNLYLRICCNQLSAEEVSLFNQALLRVLNGNLDEGLKAKILSFPSFSSVSLHAEKFEPEIWLERKRNFRRQFLKTAEASLLNIYKKFHNFQAHSFDSKDFGHRGLKNTCLALLCVDPKHEDLAWKQFVEAQNMTDQLSALQILANSNGDNRAHSLTLFFSMWKAESLVLNKWYGVQAQSVHPDTFATIKLQWEDPQFDRKNPNRVYSLMGAFGGNNLPMFHTIDGRHYQFFADVIAEIDQLNPQVAARLCSSFNLVVRQNSKAKEQAHLALKSLISKNLSKNSFEIIDAIVKNLAAQES